MLEDTFFFFQKNIVALSFCYDTHEKFNVLAIKLKENRGRRCGIRL